MSVLRTPMSGKHIANCFLKLFRLSQEIIISLRKLRRRDEGSHANFMVPMCPAIYEPTQLLREPGIVKAEQQGTGHSEHELNHFGVQVTTVACLPALCQIA